MVNKIPQVSIIITNYNYGKYLSRCLRSCLSQKYIDCEVIVVDDVSSDDSDKIIKPFLNDIVYIKNKKNLGVAGSSNVGVENCRGRYSITNDVSLRGNESKGVTVLGFENPGDLVLFSLSGHANKS